MLKAFEYKGIGFVNDGRVEAGEVDLGCCFAVVTHTFGYDRERDALGFCGGCPAMTGNIEGQRYAYTNYFCDSLQIMVDVIGGIAIGASLIDSVITYDWKQIVALILRVFVENHLHLLCPFDDELLTGLAAAICDIAIFEV